MILSDFPDNFTVTYYELLEDDRQVFEIDRVSPRGLPLNMLLAVVKGRLVIDSEDNETRGYNKTVTVQSYLTGLSEPQPHQFVAKEDTKFYHVHTDEGYDLDYQDILNISNENVISIGRDQQYNYYIFDGEIYVNGTLKDNKFIYDNSKKDKELMLSGRGHVISFNIVSRSD